MKKSELIERLAVTANLTKSQMERAYDSVISNIEGILVNEGTLVISGFGTFSKVYREAYTGRNPQTGDPIEVPAKNTVRFKASKNLKAVVNGGENLLDDEEE